MATKDNWVREFLSEIEDDFQHEMVKAELLNRSKLSEKGINEHSIKTEPSIKAKNSSFSDVRVVDGQSSKGLVRGQNIERSQKANVKQDCFNLHEELKVAEILINARAWEILKLDDQTTSAKWEADLKLLNETIEKYELWQKEQDQMESPG